MKKFLVVAYGSLLKKTDREKYCIIVKDMGTIKLNRHRFSFDSYSIKRDGGVLNLRKTNNTNDYVFAKVYAMDCKSYTNVLDRELGDKRTSNYVETKIKTKFGFASLFVVPDNKIVLTKASDRYVIIVKDGFKENFQGKKLQHNLVMLKQAVKESKKVKN